jgi:hypothetical protein
VAYKDPHDPRGLESRRKHYQANKPAYLARSRVQKQELTDLVRQLKSVPCTDCGVQYPYYVMQFDHLGDKVANVGDLTRFGNRAKLLAEVDKCDVVCANCHAERTHRRLVDKFE